MAFLTENIFWFLLIPLALGLFAVIKYYFPQMKDDGPIEEAGEEVIKNKTGMDIDLTPSSPEEPKSK